MGEPRKTFRIEEMIMQAAQCPGEHQVHDRYAELMGEVTALRAMLAPAADRPPGGIAADNHAESARLTTELNRIADTIVAAKDARAASMTRIAHELEAVVTGTEQATQRILAATEEIDQVANNLSAALKGKIEQDLAQDIRDLVIQIFEACNFQDLAGQRVSKVMAALKTIEHHMAEVLDAFRNTTVATQNGADDLHGPRLDRDHGHASQHEIDAILERGS